MIGNQMRTILHVDLDAFFCSVEELLQPELAGRPFVVGGTPQERGVVASASYPARAYGVRSAMPTSRALRLCPDLIILPGRHAKYYEHSRRIMAFLRDSAPLVEQLSIDEAFLDVSDDPLGGEAVAMKLRSEIDGRFHLPTSWGVASNKLVAKIASEVGKPKGLIVVQPGDERKFLADLPVEMLWGVGPKTAERLKSENVHKIGELANMPPGRLQTVFGEYGTELASRARGEDDRPVLETYEQHSMSAETTFSKDISDGEELRRVLFTLSERVGARLRKEELAGKTVRLKLRWADFSTITRQRQLLQVTDQDGEIYQTVCMLFDRVWTSRRRVRLLGVGVADLGPPLRQLSLFDRSWEQDSRLLQAIDSIRSRYGSKALRRARQLDEDRDNGEAS
jgi:DNA polymerase-4